MMQIEIDRQKKKNLTLKKTIEDNKMRNIDHIIKSNKKNAKQRKEERKYHLEEKYLFQEEMVDLNK